MTEDNNSENILIWFFVSPEKEIDEGTYPGFIDLLANIPWGVQCI